MWICVDICVDTVCMCPPHTYSAVKKYFSFLFFYLFAYLSHLNDIKLILVLHTDNSSKYKMQLNDDFIYYGKKVVPM